MKEFGPRQLVEIITVDQRTRRVETMLKDGGMVSVPILNIPTLFRWPKVGEFWVIRREGGQWTFVESVDPSLQMRTPDDPDEKAILVENMKEGEARIISNPNEQGSGLWINRHQAVRKIAFVIGENDFFELDHKLETEHISVDIFKKEDESVDYPEIVVTGPNTISLQFSEPVSKDAIRVIITG